ncbi:MAG TPA: DinB family protein, partial [Flavitalea sp.]|nr:DinB family protein [Flavitalea sp.]
TSFNKIPFEGSWTPSQVADHIRKAVKGIPSVLTGTSSDPGRSPDEKFELIRKIFLAFEARYKAPEFIVPAEETHSVEEMHDRLYRVFDSLISTAESVDLSQLYTDFEVRGMGKFTGFEWVEFVDCHTTRHIHQLHKIQDLEK